MGYNVISVFSLKLVFEEMIGWKCKQKASFINQNQGINANAHFLKYSPFSNNPMLHFVMRCVWHFIANCMQLFILTACTMSDHHIDDLSIGLWFQYLKEPDYWTKSCYILHCMDHLITFILMPIQLLCKNVKEKKCRKLQCSLIVEINMFTSLNTLGVNVNTDMMMPLLVRWYSSSKLNWKLAKYWR